MASFDLPFPLPDSLPQLTFTPKVKVNPPRVLDDLYDGGYYFDQNPDVALASGPSGFFPDPLDHFLTSGFAENRAPSPVMDRFFDAGAYLSQNGDVDSAIQAGTFDSAMHHFLAHGLKEGRDPGGGFDSAAYLNRNADVDNAVDNGVFSSAFEHFVMHGVDEGRFPGAAGKDGKFVLGTQEGETLSGTPNDDTIEPMQGADTVNATDGQDTIDLGNDFGWINPASPTPAPVPDFTDTVVYDKQFESPVSGSASDVSDDGDTIENFGEQDKLDLSGLSLSNSNIIEKSNADFSDLDFFDDTQPGRFFFAEIAGSPIIPLPGDITKAGVVAASDGSDGRVFVDINNNQDLDTGDLTIKLAGQTNTDLFDGSDDFVF